MEGQYAQEIESGLSILIVNNVLYQQTVCHLQNLMPRAKSGIYQQYSKAEDRRQETKRNAYMSFIYLQLASWVAPRLDTGNVRLFCFLHVTISSTITSRLPCES